MLQLANPSNLLKRNYAYYWRRSLLIADAPITLVLSLHTKVPTVARRRCALMTVKSEDVRMSLYARIKEDGLPVERRNAIFRAEMIEYRNALDHEVTRWEATPDLDALCSTGSSLRIFRELWGHVAENGFPTSVINDHYLKRHLPELDPLERQGLACALTRLTSLQSGFQAEIAARLAAEGLKVTPTNIGLATRLVAAGRAQAAHEYLLGIPRSALGAEDQASAAPATAAPQVLSIASTVQPSMPSGLVIPQEWAARTAYDIAVLIIETNPQLLAHRAEGKRAVNQVGEQTVRQLKWAAKLLDKSMGRPFWTRTREDVVELDKWFDNLPTMTGKSPRHREDSCTLEMIRAEALERIEAGDLSAEDIGFTTANTNKHYRFLSQIDKFMTKHIPGLPLVGFTEFCSVDLKDERDARHRISNEQATAIFNLPPWTGCRGIEVRLSPGNSLYHDGLYWVLLLVWYTGARREEICKLMVVDVDCIDGIWFLQIRFSETGRVKNKKSVRIIAIAEELVRLGFVEFVLAMQAAGETLLFPELMPSGGKNRKLGDVFYKLWWVYIAPMVQPKLGRGQAMHSCRHAVDDELKRNEIFVETRNDLMGWTGKGGEGETRYPGPTALAKLKAAVDLIPVVTGHLPGIAASTIRLLPADARVARPSRTKAV